MNIEARNEMSRYDRRHMFNFKTIGGQNVISTAKYDQVKSYEFIPGLSELAPPGSDTKSGPTIPPKPFPAMKKDI